jgi:hypothetical protein
MLNIIFDEENTRRLSSSCTHSDGIAKENNSCDEERNSQSTIKVINRFEW